MAVHPWGRQAILRLHHNWEADVDVIPSQRPVAVGKDSGLTSSIELRVSSQKF
jgi:hypothetical protein